MESFTESFDNGLGAFSHKWGDIDTSTSGQITLTSHYGEWNSSTAMMHPNGQDSGFGYGTFTFTISASRDVGPYALLWPGDDVWPGAEIDVFENSHATSEPYSTVHHRATDGGDAYDYALMPAGIDTLQTHTYGVVWEPGRMTFTVDGNAYRTVTDNIPADHDHGGINLVPGVGEQTSWGADRQSDDNHLTLYEFNYSPIG